MIQANSMLPTRDGPHSFRFVDLFAGIGGFHAALTALGGECVYASEIDESAATVYQRNWRLVPGHDIVEATAGRMDVPKHDLLVAGFPCQPFSKSGFQRGMDEARGTLFWNICRVLEERQPTVLLLENVRNLAGPRHDHEWDVIIRSLRELGYRVSSTPAVFSPHLLPPEMGGRPQIRERVFITATYVGGLQDIDAVQIVRNKPVPGWDPSRWNMVTDVLLERQLSPRERAASSLTASETRWIDAWDDFCRTLRKDGALRLPGFPVWADDFVTVDRLTVNDETPRWKAEFLRKNAVLYTSHRRVIDQWLKRWNRLADFPASRRKLEWQAQDTPSLWGTVMHLRPSGIRAKKPTYAPALVAITQTSIVGPLRRRITPREAARLQGLPDWFDFGDQRDALTFKQLGNGVNVGAAYYVLREHVRQHEPLVRKRHMGLADAVLGAPVNPDAVLSGGDADVLSGLSAG